MCVYLFVIHVLPKPEQVVIFIDFGLLLCCFCCSGLVLLPVETSTDMFSLEFLLIQPSFNT